MNRKYSFIGSLLLLAVTACDKQIELAPGLDDFQVHTASNTYKVGEEVVFNLSGDPNLITFYSGEQYHDYAYKDGRTVVVNNTLLSFTSANPSAAGAQPRQFSVWVSTDFNGNYTDFSHVSAATWTEITNRFTYATSGTFVQSGQKDLSDLLVAGKPTYIAFRYVTRPQKTNGAVRSFLVQTFSLTAETSGQPVTITDQTNAGFRIVEQNPETAPSRSAITATRVTLLGTLFTDAHDPATETWAISKGFDTGNIDMGPDLPVAIKGNENPRLDEHRYVYTEPGTYRVVFVATNANVNDSKQVIRELDVTITED